MAPDFATYRSVEQLIYKSCLALNDENWNDFLDLADPTRFKYSITNYSPEMRRDQCWMERDYKGLQQLFGLLEKHNSDNSPLTRHASVYTVEMNDARSEADVVSLFTIYRTQLDGINSPVTSGQTALYAIGKYLDTVALHPSGPKVVERRVRLETRQLDIGSHIPF